LLALGFYFAAQTIRTILEGAVKRVHVLAQAGDFRLDRTQPGINFGFVEHGWGSVVCWQDAGEGVVT
jgi:hypothetical protein